jgi:hypothetical protein
MSIQYFDDGSFLQMFDDGSMLVGDALGKVTSTNATDIFDPSNASLFSGDIGKFLTKAAEYVTSPQGIITLLGTGLGMSSFGQPQGGGWQGTIPTNITATRERKPMPAYTPYQRSTEPVMGQRYFSDMQFKKPEASPAPVASEDSGDLGKGFEAGSGSGSDINDILKAINTPPQIPRDGDVVPLPVKTPFTPTPIMSPEDLVPYPTTQPVQTKAQGGLLGLAEGRYLRGKTDGMADELPSSIDGKQPAALSHGEFVIPADVVSHLGNGNSDAGADVLYKMMDRVRQARTGNKKQGKQINPEKFTPGGIAAYASGGAVQKFQTGGTPSTGVTGTAPAGVTTSMPTGNVTQGNLSNWIGDYVSDYLGRGMALSKEPYQAYEGALTAGLSPIQQKAFNAAENIGGTQFDPGKFMNPFLQGALQPQLAELDRQNQINQQRLQSQFTRAGAFGGARDVLARTEGVRNLLDKQTQVTGQGYKDAYDRAMEAFFKEQGQEIADLNAMRQAGADERGIEQEMINAQKAAFEQEREDPFKKVQYAQSLITGLPTGTTTSQPNLSQLQQLGLSADQATGFVKWLTDNVLNKPAASTPTK